MAKDPAVLFYTADFLVGTMTMSHEQVGKYIRLLCLQHQKGHLPEKEMLNVCHDRDDEIFGKFEIDDDGLYYNERMDWEIAKRSKSADASRENGTKGGRKPKPLSDNPEPADVIAKRFTEFWNAYPRKIGKGAALKVWERLKPTASLHSKMLKAIEDQKKSDQWRRDNGQYIPHPTTWLNQGRWDDEPTDGGKLGTPPKSKFSQDV